MDTTRNESVHLEGDTVIGVVPSRSVATQVVDDLRAAGFSNDQIGVVARDHKKGTTEARSGLQDDPTHTRWEEGSGVGAAVGGATGLGLGLAVAGGLIPAIGPVIAGGWLVAMLASAGAGATAGTVVGALVGLGVPENEASRYQSELEAGRVLVTVRNAEGRTAQALEILRRYGAPGGSSAIGSYRVNTPAMY